MAGAKIDAEQIFADLATAIAVIRDLATFADFAKDAPEMSVTDARAKIAELEATFRPQADAINQTLGALAKDLNAVEKSKTAFNPAAIMKMAASQRTGGAPDPLPLLFQESAETGPLKPEDWASLAKFVEARRRYFIYWFGTLESFRKNAIRRSAAPKT